ncbi:MAG: TonB-dependent receptor [Burkholderiaceae bacterium]|nr:TonB-dependent receptor [Burkholderiaceae bacterium]
MTICRRRSKRVASALACACALVAQPAVGDETPASGLQSTAQRLVAARNLTQFSLEELRDVVVVSVSRRRQTLLETPSSVYVIPGEEIRRMRVTTLPEALRLAPTLQVAALDARQYAVTARGFNSNIANKLLVMVDGRTIYSPLFSGVFWESQDFVPADIERIEVITGPAGATWGTNAVNGVVNVVTKPAAETQGLSFSTTLGNEEQNAVARYGWRLGPAATARLHARTFHRGSTPLRRGGDFDDAMRGATAGLRADWLSGASLWRLSAGVYDTETDSRPLYGPVRTSGAHLLARWQRPLGDATELDVRGYVDHSSREDRFLLQDDATLFDVDAKLRHVAGRHRWLAGVGYRHGRDNAEPGLVFAFLPAQRSQAWYSTFVQDEISLFRSLALTLGLRFEHNPYSGWESLPSVRLAYTVAERALVWGALSRAVRSPARLDREIFTPPQPPFIIAGGPTFRPEVVNVAEIGYRAQVGANVSWSVTAFLHDYDRLRSAQVVGGSVLIDNRIEGEVRGLEGWANWQPASRWRLSAGFLLLDKNLRLAPGSNDPVGPSNLGNDPRWQWSMRSAHALGEQVDLLIALRRVGALPKPHVPAYIAADLQLNWNVRRDLQLSFGVRNAFDARHVEFDSGTYTGEIPRSVRFSLSWQPT